VYFDRANTAFTNMTVADVDWDLLLDTRIIHLTGITAALSPAVLAILTETVDRADAAGVPVAFDVNYRANLWAPDVAATTLRPFIQRAEILFVRSEDLNTLYGFSAESAEEVLMNAMTLTSAPNIVMTCGALGARACLDGTIISAPAWPVDIIDRLGAGDGFAAGFLHAWLDGRIEQGLEYGTAMAALALAQIGEQVQTTREELASILTDSASDLRR
jgi:2-dehydro-3-deoxygluconokinase